MRVEIEPEGPDDPGHLLSDDEWAQVQSAAHTHARTAAQTTTRAAALTVLDMPAKYHGGAQTPTVQVVHDAETPISDGYARSIGEFFQRGPDAGTSAHRMIGPNTVVRMLALDVIGYHVGPVGNRGTAGYEQCGYARFSRDDWTTPDGLAQLDTLAAELARDAEAWGIPDRHLTDTQLRAWAAAGRPLSLGGRCTHDQVHRVLGGTTHSDPMPDYPFDLLDAAVTQHRNPTPVQEDDVSESDAYNGTVRALKDVLHISDLAIPVGQGSNNKLALALFGRTGDIKAAVDAVAALVRADEATDTQATSAIVTKLDEIKALLPEPAPAGFGDPTPEA